MTAAPKGSRRVRATSLRSALFGEDAADSERLLDLRDVRQALVTES
jgi:hypothetical protein